MRDLILSEIRRLASDNGGQPPGVSAFARATGITSGRWRGVYWTRWGDALLEAGFQPNSFQTALPTEELLPPIARLARELGRLPTRAEMKLRRRQDPTFPSPGPIYNRYPSNAELVAALRRLSEREEYNDLAAIIPEATAQATPPTGKADGLVYLLKSGSHYKIGRSDDIARRFREVKVQLPETVTLIHTIRTDDPSGIEAYWHRRFADRRAEGEWFRLTADDVRAFSRRSFQ